MKNKIIRNQADADNFTKEITGKGFTETAQDVINGGLTAINNFIAGIEDKMVLQSITDFFSYEQPWTKHFLKPMTIYGSGIEQVNILINDPVDFDKNAINPTTINSNNALTNVISVVDKKVFETFVSKEQMILAFVNAGSFDSFLSKYFKRRLDSIQIFLLKVIGQDILTNIKNIKTSTIKESDIFSDEDKALTYFKQLFAIVENMEVPTKKFNLDTADGTDGRTFTTATWDELVFFMNPNTINVLKTSVLPKLFHNSYFDVFKKAIVEKLVNGANADGGMLDGQILVLHKDSYDISYKVDTAETQQYAKPLLVYIAQHLWIIRGLVPWGAGFLYNPASNTPPSDETKPIDVSVDLDDPAVVSKLSKKQIQAIRKAQEKAKAPMVLKPLSQTNLLGTPIADKLDKGLPVK